ncbi:MAG: ribonuclease VapC43 [Myxococcales bacterium]
MFVFDTNVLIYAADRSCPEHVACRGLVETARTSRIPWYVTWNIVYEFLRVTTHPRVLRSPWAVGDAWRFVDALLASPSAGILAPTKRHAAVVEQTVADLPWLAGNLLFDAHTAVLMREHGVARVYTRDADFKRFPFVDVLDPLGPAAR